MAESGVLKRRFTGIGLGLSFLAIWFFQGWLARVAIGLLGTIAVWEMYTALQNRGSNPVRAVGVAFAMLMVPAYHFLGGLGGVFLLTCVSVAVGLIIPMAQADTTSDCLISTLFPILYPGVLFGLLLEQTYYPSPYHCAIAIGVTFGAAMLTDVFAYEWGTLHGHKPLAPHLSPKKTVEGAVAGIVGSVVACMLVMILMPLLSRFIPSFQPAGARVPPIWSMILLGLVSGVVSQCGDLVASMVKRYCGVKDYGTIFPGHGGVMDRMDAILFCGMCVTAFCHLLMKG